PLDVKGKVSVAGAKLGFTDAEVAFDAIKGHGELGFDGGGARPHLTGKLDLERLDVTPYLPAQRPAKAAAAGGGGWSHAPIEPAGSDRLSGSGGFDIAVAGRGKSQQEIVNALGGKGAVSFAKGTIRGIDLAALARNVEQAVAGGAGGETEFSQLTGSFVIANG